MDSGLGEGGAEREVLGFGGLAVVVVVVVVRAGFCVLVCSKLTLRECSGFLKRSFRGENVGLVTIIHPSIHPQRLLF